MKMYFRKNFLIDFIILIAVFVEIIKIEGWVGIIPLIYLVSLRRLIQIVTHLENAIILSKF